MKWSSRTSEGVSSLLDARVRHPRPARDASTVEPRFQRRFGMDPGGICLATSQYGWEGFPPVGEHGMEVLMNRSAMARLSRLLVAATLALILAPSVATAQEGRDFLFRRPLFTLGFQVGYAVPFAGSEIFDFATDELTLSKTDFHAVTWMGSFAFRATERIDVGFEVGYAKSDKRSEFREWEDTEGLPIEQNTLLERIPVSLTVRGFLFDRGRRVSRFAWIPGKWSPFAGVGIGRMNYSFEQAGDFVDYQTLDIFTDTFLSEGNTTTFHLLAGADYSLGTRFILRGEGRYSWAEADMDRDFVDFDPIDLSGFQATVGFGIRF